jgi:peptidoglycan hydrolase-like protein with peptidoglycan-binding domain
MMRRTILSGIGTLLVAGAVAAVVSIGGGGDDERAASADERSTTGSVDTAKVTARDLVQTTDLDGTLGYGETRDLTIGGGGTITGLVVAGTIVDRGSDLVEVDGRPVVLMIGARPMWRPLAEGVADGPDVQQLEENLIALGFATADELGSDWTWTRATTTAVKNWQESRGLTKTGAVDRSQIVFLPSAVRVAQNTATVGAPAGGPIAKVTAVTKAVDVALSAKRQSLVKIGDKVQIVLPDNTTRAGTVASIGNVATAAGQGGQGDATIPVKIAFDDPANAPKLEQSPVKVRVTTNAARNVLSVPVSALLARSGGEYVVERLTAEGTTEQIPVKLGAFADNFVQVTGDVKAGDDVVVAK